MVSIHVSWKESRYYDKGVKCCLKSLLRSERRWPYLLPSQRKSFPQWMRYDDCARNPRTWGETEGTCEFPQFKWNMVLSIISLISGGPIPLSHIKRPFLKFVSPHHPVYCLCYLQQLKWSYWTILILLKENNFLQ